MAHTLPPLPYAPDALEPHIDAQTMQIHHGKHHQAYVNNRSVFSNPERSHTANSYGYIIQPE